LREEQVVTGTTGDFGTRSLSWSPNGLVLDRGVYRSPDLALLGQVSVQGGNCRPHTVANRLVCAFDASNSMLAIADATTFVLLATPAYNVSGSGGTLLDIVPGPAGQAALRINASSAFASTADAVWLFSDPALQ
jgi:hypothetical protein